MKSWFENNKKLILIGGGALLASFGLYKLFSGEIEQEQDVKEKDSDQNDQAQQDELRRQQIMSYLNTNPQYKDLTQKQKEDFVTQTLVAREETKKAVPIHLEQNGLLKVETIKQIFNRAIGLAIENLISVRSQYVSLRIKNLDQIEVYCSITIELFDVYFKILQNSVLTVIRLLDVNEQLFTESQKFHISNQNLKPSYLRDFAWHVMAEAMSKNTLTLDQYLEYLNYQIEIIPQEALKVKTAIPNLPDTALKLIVNSRVDDIAFLKFGYSDYDQVKHVQTFIQEQKFKDNMNKRTQVLDDIVNIQIVPKENIQQQQIVKEEENLQKINISNENLGIQQESKELNNSQKLENQQEDKISSNEILIQQE